MKKEQHKIIECTQPKSALKKEINKGNQIQRFDRKGQEIKQGLKYEITINDKAELFTLNSEQTQIVNLDLSNSSKQENTECYIRPSLRTLKSLELNSKEEAFLKMLSYNFEKNKRKGKRKECCVIQ
ncbi:unnamed protein product (macronuclear) [Paramecium tetraurelia]|uniref:Uncharacterized protein n=1 Tax=Paramecium tetraurelia TaxID=5888 RepID=A0DUF9_PARTE|nr:uncharacterized protein GSPATT00020348001 [Paramecium tetraurelia]CAK86676.1 unnamed protein product [Paramecium tetraurelia]|eukprot:XP_001454073.1 hypothetical protein (macronuclear) [Paramecium tetraurelia strain d4-2]